jgi:D-alanine-D-alanine ligase
MIYKHIGVVFGGRSGEHEVSLVSAQSVMDALSKKKYQIIPIGITKTGRWVCGENVVSAFTSGDGISDLPQCLLSPDPAKRALVIIHPDGRLEEKPVDVMFPVLHGPYGEDGTIQGLFEIADIPYVGSGVLSSALCMNKVFQKRIFKEAGIPQVEYKAFNAADYNNDPKRIIDTIQMVLDYPVFVKPANMGSSVGISRVQNAGELRAALELAFEYDSMIVVERAVIEPRELEIAVLGNSETICSPPGEIVPGNDFYDYDAKYVDGNSELIIPAELPNMMKEKMQELALRSYKAMQCEGLARIDFLYSKTTGELFVNELNTMPGFTSISMYPKLFEEAGIAYPVLLDRLIGFAIERNNSAEQLKKSYKPKSQWYGNKA